MSPDLSTVTRMVNSLGVRQWVEMIVEANSHVGRFHYQVFPGGQEFHS